MRMTRKRFMFLSSIVLVMMFMFSNMAVFAEDLGSWSTKASIPTARAHAGAAVVNGKIYVIGGLGGLNKVEEYDPSANSWTTKANMPTGRYVVGIATVNNKIYAIGGVDSNGISINTVEEYDPTTDTWVAKANMPTARYSDGICVFNNKIYVVGGYNGTSCLSTVEEYNPATNTWTTKAGLLTARNHISVVVLNGKIYAVGGTTGDHSKSTKVEMYEPNTNTWIVKKDLNNARFALGAVAINNKIFAFGGFNGGIILNTIEYYDPTMDSWTDYNGTMPNRRYGYSIASMNNNVYLISGNANGNISNTVDVFSLPKEITANPTNLTAAAGNAKVELSWSAVAGATSYNVKRATTAGGPYATIANNVTGTTYTDTAVTNGTTYYYVVTAVDANGESANSNEASATPQAPTVTGKALLVITLVDNTEKEYELSMTEIDSFVTWYDTKAAGTGKAYYVFDKKYNKANFMSRKDYIVFDKIRDFEVMQYE